MKKLFENFGFIIGLIIIGPVACIICLMDRGNGKTFKENFKEVFAISKWSKMDYFSDKDKK